MLVFPNHPEYIFTINNPGISMWTKFISPLTAIFRKWFTIQVKVLILDWKAMFPSHQ